MRNARNIREAYEVFEQKSADAVISICELEHSIQICNKLGENGSMYNFIDSNKVGARQLSDTYYQLNGAIYIQKTELLMNKQNFITKTRMPILWIRDILLILTMNLISYLSRR